MKVLKIARVYLFPIFLVVFVINTIYAQSSAELSEVRKQKHHIELDVKNVFDGLRGATIFYKRKKKPGKLIEVNALKLWRFSLSLDGTLYFTEDPNRNLTDTTFQNQPYREGFIIGGSIGLEKQIYKKGIVVSYGTDMTFYVSNGLYGWGWRFTDTSYYIDFEGRIQDFEVGIRPFFGLKYYFTPQLSLGIETGVVLAFNTRLVKDSFSEDVIINGQSYPKLTREVSSRSSTVSINSENLRFLTLGYNF